MTKLKRIKLFLALSTIFILTAGLMGCKKNTETVVTAPPDEYINYTINGVPYSFVVPADNIIATSGGLNFVLRTKGNRIPVTQDSITLVFDHISISVGTIQHLMAFDVNQIPTNSTINAALFVAITECGPTGQYISGNFSGAFKKGPPPTNTIYNITCNFRIKRTF